jgi:competence ComEA-like helix-hairpin-helix protein
MVKKILLLFLFFMASGLAADCIDINEDGVDKLDELSGIGPAKAEAIIGGRPYKSLEDLLEIKGIGESTLDKIKKQEIVCTINESNKKKTEDTEEKDTVLFKVPSSKRVLKLESSNQLEDKVIYRSKNQVISENAIYLFAGFLIFLLIYVFYR